MKPSHFYLPIILCQVAFSSLSQPAALAFAASLPETERMNIVRTSIPLTEWHEKSFWTQYHIYFEKTQSITSTMHITLYELAKVNKLTNTQHAFEYGIRIISNKFDELSLKRQFFDDIAKEHNGIIALQFLQTEVMIDMMESSATYELTLPNNVHFYADEFPAAQVKQAKYNIITKALSLSPDEIELFFPVYSRYEQESEDVLGEAYNLYELFASEASDFTPSLAKRQGYDLLTIMEREIKLKEKYFNEMTTTAGCSLGARFLSWEDFYSTACKLDAMVKRP